MANINRIQNYCRCIGRVLWEYTVTPNQDQQTNQKVQKQRNNSQIHTQNPNFFPLSISGGSMIIGAIVFAVKIGEDADSGSLGAGFAVAIVSGILGLAAGVTGLVAYNKEE